MRFTAVGSAKRLFFGILVVISSVGLATLLTLNITVVRDHAPNLFFFGTIALTTYFLGRIGGSAATLLSGAILIGFVIPTFHADADLTEKVILVLIFLSISPIIIVLFDTFRGKSDLVKRDAKRLSDLFENNPLPIFQVDLATSTFVDVNQAAVRFYGYAKDEFLKLHLDDIRCLVEIEASGRSSRVNDQFDTPHMISKHRNKAGDVLDVEIYRQEVHADGMHIREVLVIDIGEKIRAEKAAREIENRLRIIIDNLDEGLIMANRDHEIIHANPAAIAMLGLSGPEDLTDLDQPILNSAMDLNGEELAQESLPIFRTLAGDEVKDQVICTADDRPGAAGKRTLQASGVSIRDGNGVPEFAIVRFIDITERIASEVALRESRDQLDAIVSSAMDAVITIDADRKIVVFNAAAENMFLSTAAEMLGKTMDDLIPEPFRAIHSEHVDGFVNSGVRERQSMGRGEDLYGVRSSGEVFRMEASLSSTVVGGKSYHTAILRDISGRIKADEAAKEALRWYNDLAENSVDLIYTHALDGKILSVNEYGLDVTGYTLEELLKLNIVDVVTAASAEKSWTIIDALLKGRLLDDRRVELVAKDGTIIEMDTNIWLVYENRLPVAIRGIARDVTSREQALAELRHSEERYRTLVENAPDMICTSDLNGNFTSANSFTTALMGYSHDEIMQMNFAELMTPESTELAQSMIGSKLAGDKTTSYETDMIVKDGSRLKLELKSWLVMKDGKPVGIQAIGRDITKQNKALVALRNSEERYRTLVENAKDVIYTMDFDGNITSVNSIAGELSGYSIDELVEGKYKELLPTDSAALVKEMIAAKVNGQESSEYELEMVARDGSPGTLSIKSWLIYEDGKPVGVQGIGRNVTTQKKAFDAVRRSEARYRTLVENAQDAIFSNDLGGNFTSINKYGAEACGYTVEESLKMNVLDTIAPDHRPIALDVTEKLKRGEAVGQQQIDLLHKDGSRLSFAVKTWLDVENGVPVGIDGIARDISDFLKLQEKLRVSQKLESIGTLAGGIAHDFNNLMTVVNGYSELALRSIRPDDPNKTKFELIKETGQKAAELTHQLLAFSRKQVLQPEVLDLNLFIKNIKKMLSRLIRESIVLKMNLEPGLRPIMADPGQMEQMLFNLAIFARDEMLTGGQLRIETRNAKPDEIAANWETHAGAGEYIIISFTDTGKGMPDDVLQRVFDPYFSVGGIGHGSGLGLATVHGIVKQSGGDIVARSVVGEGTTFEILWPNIPHTETVAAADAVATRTTGGGETVLVVEDNDIVGPVVIEMLESMGYRTISASSGHEAMASSEPEPNRSTFC